MVVSIGTERNVAYSLNNFVFEAPREMLKFLRFLTPTSSLKCGHRFMLVVHVFAFGVNRGEFLLVTTRHLRNVSSTSDMVFLPWIFVVNLMRIRPALCK